MKNTTTNRNINFGKCPKSGIKIHETNNKNTNTNNNDQEEFFKKIKELNRHTGVRVTDGRNEYKEDPFDGFSPFKRRDGEKDIENVKYNKSLYETLDLNIDNYSREDIYKLFGVRDDAMLSEEIMKECKKLVLKTHPDKCKLDSKYFLFFSKAYKRLFSIYEFQNKSTNKKEAMTSEYYNSDNNVILDKVFDKDKKLKDPKNFNSWFNEQFEKHRLDDPVESGYGNWLKSDEDIVFVPNVSKANMASEIEKHKKHVQSLTTYNGVNELTASTFGGSSLMQYNSNFTSGSLFSNDGMGYTDLRQAYAESVIPVTEEDYKNMPKFKNLNEYKNHRNSVDTKPLDKDESMKQLYHQNKLKDEESTALAFYYARQAEKAKQNEESFWSGLKQLTNF
jgi:hypothetical protein